MGNELINAGILGIGSCLPETTLTNDDLEKMVDTSDEWIIQRTGISERRVLGKGQPAYELGAEAARKALEDAGITAEEVGLIIVSTESPDYLIPSTACLIQGKIGAVNAAAFDVIAACSGFVYGMNTAELYISSRRYRYVLVVACEGLSRATDWEDRGTCVLFGDGAGAVVMGPVEKGYGILATHIGADGQQWDQATLPCFHVSEAEAAKREHENKRVIWMNGSSIMKFAVKKLAQASLRVLEAANMIMEDIKYVVPHQANQRIIEGGAKALGIPAEKMFSNIKSYGNISSACIPVALDVLAKNGQLAKGDSLILVAFGGGLTWASALVRWSK